MVKKFDVFIELYEQGGSRKIIDILRNLKQKKSEYDKVRKILEKLTEMKLVAKSKNGYEAVMNSTNQHLFEMLRYCIKNGVNYNELFDATLAKYVCNAIQKKFFFAKDMKFHPKTFAKISSVLEKNGLLIVLSRKPFKAIVPYNSFIGDLVAYYGQDPKVAKRQQDDFLDDIKKELSKFRRLKSANNRRYQEILETFQIKFIHHSLSIEGNPMTLAQTFKLLRERIVPENMSIEAVEEVRNYQKAFLQMVRNVRDENPLTKESILNYHFLAFQHNDAWAGKFRDDDVFIKGNPNFKVAHHTEIENMILRLLEKYNEFTGKRSLTEIFDFAAYLHNEFQHIHPFFDGNSRTTRLITFHFLQMHEIPIFDIPLGLLEEYVLSTKGAKKRDDRNLNQALQRIVLYNLKTLNEKLLQ